jgi:molybdopterin-guanine dinucleotide biosynthesis protein MobB
MSPPLFGVVGWKNSGKTTLMAGLVRELAGRGFVVSVIKHLRSCVSLATNLNCSSTKSGLT